MSYRPGGADGLDGDCGLSPQCGDVGCNVLGLNSCKRHGRHPGVWIHQERGQPIDVEVRLARNCRERRGFRRRLALIAYDDVTGCAPSPGNLPAVVGVCGRRSVDCDDRKDQGKNRRASTPRSGPGLRELDLRPGKPSASIPEPFKAPAARP